jgi:hypothetical protein
MQFTDAVENCICQMWKCVYLRSHLEGRKTSSFDSCQQSNQISIRLSLGENSHCHWFVNVPRCYQRHHHSSVAQVPLNDVRVLWERHSDVRTGGQWHVFVDVSRFGQKRLLKVLNINIAVCYVYRVFQLWTHREISWLASADEDPLS